MAILELMVQHCVRNLIVFFFIGSSLGSSAQIQNLDAFITSEMSAKQIPGLAACVVKDGGIAWKGSYGYIDLVDSLPVSDTSLFTIASISKLICATAVIELVADGLLDLDTHIGAYLPFDVRHPQFSGSSMTARMLLEHRSGLNDPESFLYTFQVNGDSPIPLGQYLQDYLTPGGANYATWYWSTGQPPTNNTHYSNLGFGLLAYLVESISGMPYDVFCDQRIFDPLCMNKTTFWISDVDTNQLAMPYSYAAGQYQSEGRYGFPNYPAGLLKTCLKDLSNFLIAYTQRGFMSCTDVFSSIDADQLTPYAFNEPNLGWWNGTSWTYTIHFPNDQTWYHGGYMPGVRTRLNYYPQDSSGLIILTNGEGNYREIEDTLAFYRNQFVGTLPIQLECETLNCELVQLSSKAVLGGPYDPAIGLMHDSLAAKGLIPLVEPYTDLGYSPMNSGQTIHAPVLNQTGNQVLVDWVLLQFRNSASPSMIAAEYACLLQRDGSLVMSDGSEVFRIGLPQGDYFLSVVHRNHLAMMVDSVFSLSTSISSVDFRSDALYGVNGSNVQNGIQTLWAGDVNGDGLVKYAGAGNDRDPILVEIGGSFPTNTVLGYSKADVNLDGMTKYVGVNNDRDRILLNVGGNVPTNARIGQLP